LSKSFGDAGATGESVGARPAMMFVWKAAVFYESAEPDIVEAGPGVIA
jgi:hypothetical protein